MNIVTEILEDRKLSKKLSWEFIRSNPTKKFNSYKAIK